MLDLKSIGGRGYTQGCLYLTFYYGRHRGVATYRPEPNRPAIFLCWNDVFKRILSRRITAEVGREENTVSYRFERISPYGSNDDNFHFRIVRPQARGPSPYDWSLEVVGVFPATKEVLGSDGPLKSEAPASGYQHELVLKMDAGDPNWSSQMTKRFYTCSHDGAVYAGVEMKVQLAADGGEPTATIHYTANFGGSRDLVPGPVKPAGK